MKPTINHYLQYSSFGKDSNIVQEFTPQEIEEMLEQRKKFKESRLDNFTITNTIDNKIIVIQDLN